MWILHVLCLCFCLLATNCAIHSYNYQDLVKIGADCPPRDTCANAGPKSFESRNCECDSECQSYDDCCIDARLSNSKMPRTDVECVVNDTSAKGVYAINRCESGWRGPAEVRQRCEVLNDLSDPIIAAPVADTVRGVTYKNRYCAECNSAKPENLKTWLISLSCDSLKGVNDTGVFTGSYIRDNLVYKNTFPNRNRWGLYHWNKELDRPSFYPCNISFWMPDDGKIKSRPCRTKLISTCSTKWRVQSDRRKCAAYTAVVYINSKVYRNPHCAKCNNEDMERLSCVLGLHSRKKQPVSFALLLDVNRTGNGTEGTCPDGQTYDTFFQRCRKLVCALPGYVMKNERCVRG